MFINILYGSYYLLFITFRNHMCVCFVGGGEYAFATALTCGSQGQLGEIISLLPFGVWGLNSSYKTWQQMSFPTEPSCRDLIISL